MEDTIVFFVIALLIVLWTVYNTEKRQLHILENGYHTRGKVISYENKYTRVAGSWTWLDYPVVEYIDESRNLCNSWVKYYDNKKAPFPIGAIIEIVIYEDIVYYKKALKNTLLAK